MKIEKIKPVPKYILARIRKRMKTDTLRGKTMYYAYLTKNDGELAKVTVAVRVSKKFVYKQCAVHGLHSKKCFVKDMAFSYLGGYRVGWFAEGVTKTQRWYEDGEWGYADNKYFDVYAPVLNLDYVLKMPKYKYCAVDLFGTTKVLQYLKLYEQFPQTEYLVKAGLKNYATSVQILKLVGKDNHFAKWLMRNKQHLLLLKLEYSDELKAILMGYFGIHNFHRFKITATNEKFTPDATGKTMINDPETEEQQAPIVRTKKYIAETVTR